MTIEQNDPTPPAGGPNLMVLKGITVGLGVLLMLGFVLLAVRMGNTASGLSDEEAAPPVMAVASITLDALPALALAPGEQIVSMSADQGRVLLLIEGGASTRMVSLAHTVPDAQWQPLAVAIAPVSPQRP